jgi:D-beta-D-heptose 7-phosphate kinase/D-beta-D-heptose 1-phosphate adenosyltransferase
MKDKPVLIIGDSCKDVFKYCKCERLCPEAPVPVLDILETKANGGMAMNVYYNYKALSDNVEIITSSDWEKNTKTRFIDSITNHMFIRIDHDETEKEKFFKYRNKINFEKYAAIILSDYDKGFLTNDDITFISKNHKLTFLDTKKILSEWANDITYIKINRKEFGLSYDSIKNNKLLKSKIIETVGSEGAVFRDKTYKVKKVEIKDLSGAGDTFLASLVYGYLTTNNINESIELANRHATIVVQRRGVTTIE